MSISKVEKEINNFLESFGKEEEAGVSNLTEDINQIIQYTEEHDYSKGSLYAMILNGWMVGFMSGYRRGTQETDEKK